MAHIQVNSVGRSAGATFLPGVVRIEKAAFGEQAWPLELFKKYAVTCPDLFLIARVGLRIAGYSITCVSRGRGELVSIAVSRRFRGRGIATALLRRTLRSLKHAGVTDFRLTVRTENHDAIRLYRAMGFVRTRTERGYYEDGADGWRMRLELG